MKYSSLIEALQLLFKIFVVFGLFAFANCVHAKGNRASECEALPLQVQLPRLVVVGEVHGTNEHQKIAAQLVCRGIREGRNVVLALEIRSTEQSRIDEFLRSAMTPEDTTELLSGQVWQSDFQFGVASRAMLELIKTVGRWRASGASVAITTFDRPLQAVAGQPSTAQQKQLRQRREDAMAANIDELASASSNDLVVVLVGRAHIAKNDDAKPTEFRSIATLLAPKHKFLSVGVAYSGGTAWVCTFAEGKNKCGPQDFESYAPPLGDLTIVVDAGVLSASPPAVETR